MIPTICFIDDIVVETTQPINSTKTIVKTMNGHEFEAGLFSKEVMENIGTFCLFKIEMYYFRSDYRKIPSMTISEGVLLDFMSFD